MTVEEAGHIILQGKEWVDCLKCSGAGRLFDPPKVSTDGYSFSWSTRTCLNCLGLRRSLSDKYIQACEILGIDKHEMMGFPPIQLVKAEDADESDKADG